MRHKIDIWSKNKETGKGFIIEAHIELTEEDVEDLALADYLNDHDVGNDRIYWATLDSTIHD